MNLSENSLSSHKQFSKDFPFEKSPHMEPPKLSIENFTVQLEKNELNTMKKSLYLSSVYSSEDEKRKIETFQKKSEFLSDETYFRKIKEEKFPKAEKKTWIVSPKNKHSINDDYIEMQELESKLKDKIFAQFQKGAVIPTVFLLLSSTIGGGFFLVTSFQKNNVYLSIAANVFCGFLSYYSAIFLIESCHECKRYSYAGLSEASNLTQLFKVFINFIDFFYNLSVITIYLDMMGNIISFEIQNSFSYPIAPPDYTNKLYVLIIIGVMTVLIFPMSIFREFHKLWFGCLIGIFFLLFILICTIYLFAQEKKDIKSNDFELSYTLVLPIFLFSCHNNVPDIFQEIKNSSKKLMKISMFSATNIAMVIYILMGMFFWIEFNPMEYFNPCSVSKIIEYKIIQIDLFIFAFYLVFIIPINMKPCKESLLYIIAPKSGRDSYKNHLMLTAFCGILAIVIAIFQNATKIIYGSCSFTSALVCFVFPAIFYFRIALKNKKIVLKNILVALVYFLFIPFVAILSVFDYFK